MTMNQQARLFKVTLSDWNGAVRGRPTRKIAISAKASLYDLAAVTIESLILIWIMPLDSMIISKTGHALRKAMNHLLMWGRGIGFLECKKRKSVKFFIPPNKRCCSYSIMAMSGE